MIRAAKASRLWLVATLAMALVIARALWQIRPRSEYFWDFRVYFCAARAAAAGLDPYRPESLQSICHETLPIAYVYPPLTLWFFRPGASLPQAVTFYLHMGLLVASLVALLALGRRRFFPHPSALFLLLFWFAFSGAGSIGLYAGNLALVETLALWFAASRFVAGRYASSAAVVTAVSLFKLSPAVLLLPLMLVGGAATLGLFAVFAVATGLQWWLSPAWRDAVRGTDWERGAVNPSSLAFVTDITGAWYGYAVVLVAVGVAVYLTLRGRARALMAHEDGRTDLAMLAVATMAITLPRFKDYSYILLIFPLVHAARKMPKLQIGLFLLSLFSLNGLFETRLSTLPRALRLAAEYQPLASAWSIFVVLLVALVRS